MWCDNNIQSLKVQVARLKAQVWGLKAWVRRLKHELGD